MLQSKDVNNTVLLEQYRISVVIPVYCNAESLNILWKSLTDNVYSENKSVVFETVFVDDGSEDDSLNILINIKNNTSYMVRVLKLTRNFGQVSAIMAGIEKSSGDYVVVMSADLQDPPELINEMIKVVFEDNYEIVIATRESRDESYYRILTSRVFYWIMQKLTFKEMPLGGFDYLLISKHVRRVLIQSVEVNPFFQGQILFCGFRTFFLSYSRKERKYGESKWTLPKKIKTAIDSIISYSYMPIRVMTLIGLITSLVGFGYAVLIVVSYYRGNTPFQGWAPLMILMLLLSGIQMIMLGVIGEYIWRTLEQVRRRPQYILETIYE